MESGTSLYSMNVGRYSTNVFLHHRGHGAVQRLMGLDDSGSGFGGHWLLVVVVVYYYLVTV